MSHRKKRLSPGCYKLGKALRDMIAELRIKNKIKDYELMKPISMLKLSPAQIEKGRQIINRMKIKYPLQRDAKGRYLKGEVIE